MKKIFPLACALALAVASASTPAHAEESATIPLAPPAGFAKEACPAPVWAGTTAVWKGVIDKRSAPEIGLQTQKGKEPIPVFSEPPAAEAFDVALRELFPTCGMKLAEKGVENSLDLSAELREFYAGVEKKLLTGKSQARSAITFIARKGASSTSVTVGYEIDSKRIRSGSIRHLERAIAELFVETLRQVPKTQEMRELK